MSSFDLAQTFYVDSLAVQRSEMIFITAIDLYFYAKPTASKTKSGIDKPGVTVFVCSTLDDGTPILSNVFHPYSARVEYDNIVTSTSGEDSAYTTFTFNQPVPVLTDRIVGFLVKFDGSDPDFKLWYNKVGDAVLGTTTLTNVNSGKVDGHFFKITNGSSLTPERDADLSFKIKIARFNTTSSTFKTLIRDHEVLKVDTITGTFKGGEKVFSQRANSTGNVAVSSSSTILTGNGTAFAAELISGDNIVVLDGANSNLLVVSSVTNATSLIVTTPPTFNAATAKYYKTVVGTLQQSDTLNDYLILQDSSANSTMHFAAANTVRGSVSNASANIVSIESYAVNSVIPNYLVITPAFTTAQMTVNFANTGQSLSSTRERDVTPGIRGLIADYDAILASRTTEVTASPSFRSFNGTLVFRTDNPYVSPFVREENLDLFVERYEINNDDTNEFIGRGNAKARYISKLVNLGTDQKAEDLKVYIRAFRPQNSNIKVYAKFRNSEDYESFDVKDWTELTPINDNLFSNPVNIYDRVEIEYRVPKYRSGTLLSQTFTSSSGNAKIVASSSMIVTSNCNSQTGVANTTDIITTSASHGLSNNDRVQYIVAAGNTAIGGLSNGSYYYVTNVASSSFQLTTAVSGNIVNVTSGLSETGHLFIPDKAIVANNLVRLYSPILADNYIVDLVTEANSTVVTLASAISNSSLVGSGFRLVNIDRPNSAYIDIQNENVLTYHNKTSARFETYDSFALKIVMLSSDGTRVPFIDDIRAVAVSA